MDIFWNLPIPGSRVSWCFFILSAETGGICIAPRPSEDGAEILPGMAMRPFFGIVPALMDEKVCGILQRLSPAHLPRYSSDKLSTCPAFCPLLSKMQGLVPSAKARSSHALWSPFSSSTADVCCKSGPPSDFARRKALASSSQCFLVSASGQALC